MHISLGPLKSVVSRRPNDTPKEAAGQEPKPVETVLPAKVDDDSLLKQRVDRLIQSSDYPRAVTLLRDAIDEKPFDVDRRVLLVQTLLDANRSADAGEEAERAILLAPEREELRALAAKAWMSAGAKDQARAALNEALIRDPNGMKTRLMLAELSLARLEPDKALDHLDLAIKEHPSKQAYYMRALCRALLGEASAVTMDLTSAKQIQGPESASEVQRLYVLAASTIDDSFKTMGDDMRAVMQRALARPDDSSVHQKVSDNLHLLQARQAFLNDFPIPPVFKGSNNRRALSLSLFVQTMLAMQQFFGGGGPDSMTDARVDLGEALKEAAGARAAFVDEQKPPEKPEIDHS